MLGSGLFRFILAILGAQSKSGFIALASGNQTVEIKTGWTPSQVWVNIGHSSHVPCCGGGEDMFDITIIKHGFIFTANIKSNCRKIKWIAIK